MKEFRDPILLITSRNLTGAELFGTGFVFYQDEGSIYVLTCAHVVGDFSQVKAGGETAKVALFLDKTDIAVLQVQGKLSGKIEPLKLDISYDNRSSFTIKGFKTLTEKKYERKPLDSTIRKPIDITEKGQSDSIPGWEFNITDGNLLQPGYSGSPLINETGNNVVGIVTHLLYEGEKGIAISIEAISTGCIAALIEPQLAKCKKDYETQLAKHKENHEAQLAKYKEDYEAQLAEDKKSHKWWRRISIPLTVSLLVVIIAILFFYLSKKQNYEMQIFTLVQETRNQEGQIALLDQKIKDYEEQFLVLLQNEERVLVAKYYSPTGKMGDIDDITIKLGKDGVRQFHYKPTQTGGTQHEYESKYHPDGTTNDRPAKFAGVMYLGSDWGRSPCVDCDLSKRGVTQIVWKARSLSGEVNVQFVIGGINWTWKRNSDGIWEQVNPPFPDSMPKVNLGIKTLTKEWQEFPFDLSGQEEDHFKNVVGGFGWTISWGDNAVVFDHGKSNKEFIIELRNIRYERKEGK